MIPRETINQIIETARIEDVVGEFVTLRKRGSNLIQPFWALPALAIAKLNAKDIMGFCLIDLVVSGIIIISGLLIWAI